MLRWDTDVNSVQAFDSGRGQFVALEGVGSQWHRHQAIEITAIESGDGIRVVGDSTTEILDEKNMVLLGRGLPHYWNFNGPSSGACVQFDDVRLMDAMAEPARMELMSLVESSAHGLEINNQTGKRALGILSDLVSDSSTTSMVRFGLFLQLLGTLADADARSMRQISSIRFDGLVSDSNYVEMQTAIGWIMENFQSQIKLDDVLNLVHMSKASFSRHFAKCTGLTFSQFVNDLRVSNASKLLHSSQLSISQIAFESGFENLSNFNRIFRKRKGMTPSQYRIATLGTLVRGQVTRAD